jgi:phosphatidylglycerophosphate synthase
MGMHELHKRAEWFGIPDAKRTAVQRLAARTQGVVTPANGISLLGAVITIMGLTLFYQQHYLLGIVFVGIGRICDVLDGHVARSTHTTSPVGEGVDAALDKLVVLLATVLLVMAHVLPLVLAAILILIQLIIAALSLAVRHDGTGIHPTRTGKYAMFALWLSIGLFMIAHVLDTGAASTVFFWVGATLMSLTILADVVALKEYVRAVRNK